MTGRAEFVGQIYSNFSFSVDSMLINIITKMNINFTKLTHTHIKRDNVRPQIAFGYVQVSMSAFLTRQSTFVYRQPTMCNC